ncbi:hypothetical protein Bhyg_03350, partial [Pseudolycoriella hygida]
MEVDIFFNILKNVVLRSRSDDHLVDALKFGMTGTFHIKSKDLLDNWKDMTSTSQRVRQRKLLGYWAIENYPALGRKFFGDTWYPPQSRSVEVLGNSWISPHAIDKAIFRKLNIRIIALNVCESTLGRLKHFVEAPSNIDEFNGIKFTKNLKSFDIKSDYVDVCWKALKHGKPTLNNQPSGNGKRTVEDEGRTDNASLRMEIINIRKEFRELSTLLNPAEHEKEKLVKENEILKGQIEANTDLIKTLQKSLDSTSKLFEMLESSWQIQINYFNKLNSETSESNLKLKKDLDDLKRHATSVQTCSEEQMHVLKEKLSVAENSILEVSNQNEKLERDFLHSKQCATTTESSLQNQVQDLTKSLSESEAMNLFTSDSNRKLELELMYSRQNANSVEASLRNQIQDLVKNVSEAEKLNKEMSESNLKLKTDLDDLKRHATSVQTCSGEQIDVLKEKLSVAERSILEVSDKNEKLERDFLQSIHDAANAKASLHSQVQDLTKNLSDAENKEMIMFENIRKLNQELDRWKHYAENKETELIEARKSEEELSSLKNQANILVAQLQSQMQNFNTCLKETEETKSELIRKNMKLENELKRLRGKETKSESGELLVGHSTDVSGIRSVFDAAQGDDGENDRDNESNNESEALKLNTTRKGTSTTLLRIIGGGDLKHTGGGELEHTAGELEHTAGELEHTAGELEHTAGELEHTAGELEHTAGELEHTGGA